MSERTYDIVLFGATGFTGELTARYLAENGPEGMRWALAGRRLEGLKKVEAGLSDCARPPSGVVVADVSDPSSLLALAASSRVLITTVGPYERFGEPVLAACVQAGCHYVDITGEPQFVDRMALKYGDEAREKGLRVVSCCGFDSVPHDLGVLFTLKHLSSSEEQPSSEPIEVQGFVKSNGTFSGGTWHSAIAAFSQFKEHQAERKTWSRPSRTDGRSIRGIKPKLRFEKKVGAWTCPLPTIDPAVVLRSARLMDEYGPKFRYGHYAQVKKLRTVLGAGVGVSTLFGLSQFQPSRKLLLSVKSPGDGPTPEKRARSWFTVTFVGRAGDKEVVTQVAGGDPGYTETSKMLAESAMCIAFDTDRLPSHTGIITPAAAMGWPLIERLQEAGISFRVL